MPSPTLQSWCLLSPCELGWCTVLNVHSNNCTVNKVHVRKCTHNHALVKIRLISSLKNELYCTISSTCSLRRWETSMETLMQYELCYLNLWIVQKLYKEDGMAAERIDLWEYQFLHAAKNCKGVKTHLYKHKHCRRCPPSSALITACGVANSHLDFSFWLLNPCFRWAPNAHYCKPSCVLHLPFIPLPVSQTVHCFPKQHEWTLVDTHQSYNETTLKMHHMEKYPHKTLQHSGHPCKRWVEVPLIEEGSQNGFPFV